LEGAIIGVHHEQLTLALMERINAEMNGSLDMAISIFKGNYHKSFLHQLVSSQLDLDRMDYLKRDSFFTGVAEGAIGHDRIIKMLSVVDNDLVVEEKAIYSIEKFLMARTFMYYQVYLHKTVISVEQMLFRFTELLRKEVEARNVTCPSYPLQYFMTNRTGESDLDSEEVLNNFINLDDVDIMSTIKYLQDCNDPALRFYSKGIADRRLLKVELKKVPFSCDLIEEMRLKVVNTLHLPDDVAGSLVISGKERSETYSPGDNEIKVLLKNGEVVDLSSFVRRNLFEGPNITHFLCYPKFK
ncbi:MAG: phosphohydrolase, partial [Flavobacteriales bacterium]|nr:phosphohydrolase [Flavobacteriales bacterium]